MSQAKAQRAKTALDKLEGKLKAEGFKGKITSVRDVSKFVEEKGIEFPEDQWTNYEAAVDAVKAFAVSENSPTSITVDWVEDGGMTEMPPEEMEQEKSASKLAKKVSEMERELKSLRELGTKTRVEVSTPGDSFWRGRKRFGENVYDTADDAYKAGLWFIAESGLFAKYRASRVEDARKQLQSMGVKTLTTSMGSAGPLVPEEFSNTIINIQKQYGVMRRIAQIETMATDTKSIPRHADGGGYVGYFPEEGGSLTAEDLNFENVKLQARKYTILQVVSSETLDDTPTAIGELISQEMARATAKKEDECGLMGDGTLSSYGRILGIIPQFGASATNDARSVTGGDTSDAHTKDHLISLRAKLGDEHRDGAIYLCSPAMKSFIIDNIASDVGGLGLEEFAGKPYDTLWGDPIVTTNVMNTNSNTGGDVVDLLYLNPRNAGLMGSRKGIEIDVNPHAFWSSDRIGYRAISRFDFNWFNLGSTATAGAVVALWQT